jgi:hypothetical protein
VPACSGEDASKFVAEYEGTGTIEPSCLSTVPRTTGRITVDSGPVPRVAAPPSPPMPTSGRSPHRPLPPSSLPFRKCEIARVRTKKPEPPKCVRRRSGPGFQLPAQSPSKGRGGDKTDSEIPGRGQPLPIGKFSAGLALGDSLQAGAAACGIAARAAAARCGVERRNCCRFPVGCPARGASGHARDIPESNTAPSSRADIASFCLAVRWAGRNGTKNAGKHVKRKTPRETGGIVRRGV